MEIRQPQIPVQDACEQFQGSRSHLRHTTGAQYDLSVQSAAHEPQRRPAMRYSGTNPSLQHGNINNSTPTSTDIPESATPKPMSNGAFRRHREPSYVELQRKAQQIHSIDSPPGISGPLQPGVLGGTHMDDDAASSGDDDSDQPERRTNFIQQTLSRIFQRKTDTHPWDGSREPILQHQQSLTTRPHWPFHYKASSSKNKGFEIAPLEVDSDEGEEDLLPQGQESLLLRKLFAGHGNRGPPSPSAGTAPPQSPKLQRRNAQRKTHRDPKLPGAAHENIQFHGDRFNANVRRRTKARNVKLIHPSPVELAKRKGILPQIIEVAEEAEESESSYKLAVTPPDEAAEENFAPKIHEIFLEGKTIVDRDHEQGGKRKRQSEVTHQSPHYSTDEKAAQHDCHDNAHSRSVQTLPESRRFPLVVKEAQQTSVIASAPTSPPSTKSILKPTPATAPAPEPETLAQSGSQCGTPGCTWPYCSRIRGNFRMPVPDTDGKVKSDSGSGASEVRNEADIVSAGNGFSFLRLN